MLQFTNSLDSLMLQKKGKSRCINQENPKGEKGKGGMAAGSLGAGRKGSPCMQKIIPGETRVLAEMEGPGVIQHIWMTVTDRTEKDYYVLRDLVLRITGTMKKNRLWKVHWEIFSAVGLQENVW